MKRKKLTTEELKALWDNITFEIEPIKTTTIGSNYTITTKKDKKENNNELRNI